MKITSKLTALFLGVGLLAVGTQPALSQRCDTGYQGGAYSDYCVPTCPPVYSDNDCYEFQTPRYSRNNYRNDHGNNYDRYYDRRVEAYQAPVYERRVQRGGCDCPDCTRGGGVSSSQYSRQSDVESRLSYIEMILSYIVNFLGLNDEIDDSSSHPAPRANRSAPSGVT